MRRNRQESSGESRSASTERHYTVALVIMIVLLVVAFVCNELVRPRSW